VSPPCRGTGTKLKSETQEEVRTKLEERESTARDLIQEREREKKRVTSADDQRSISGEDCGGGGGGGRG